LNTLGTRGVCWGTFLTRGLAWDTVKDPERSWVNLACVMLAHPGGDNSSTTVYYLKTLVLKSAETRVQQALQLICDSFLLLK